MKAEDEGQRVKAGKPGLYQPSRLIYLLPSLAFP